MSTRYLSFAKTKKDILPMWAETHRCRNIEPNFLYFAGLISNQPKKQPDNVRVLENPNSPYDNIYVQTISIESNVPANY